MPEPEIDVLLAEDEPIVRRAAARILTSHELSTESATTCTEAKDRLQETTYQVLLCDLMLPEGSGFEVLEEACALQPALQSIVVTGYATADNALLAFAGGAFDYLPKPFDWTELLGVVDRALCYRKRVFESDQPSSGTPNPTPTRPSGIAALGRHSWALLDRDGSATLGPAETFFGCLHNPEDIELPEVGSHVVQGLCLAHIRSSGNRVHRIWAPLGGRVLEANTALKSHPAPMSEDPFGEGWLVRIVPSRQEHELRQLTDMGLDPIVARPLIGPT